MFDWNDLRKSTASWKLSAAQKQRIESHCLHAKKPAPAILLWMKRCAKPALAVAVAAAAIFAMLLIWPLFRQPNANKTISAGAPEARPDTPYEKPEDSTGKQDPDDNDYNNFERHDDQTQPVDPKEPTEPEIPAEQTPKTVVPAEWKDPAVTDAQRAALFELTQKYRIDALYDFDEKHPIDLEAFKYYCWYHLTEQEITFVEGGCTYPGDRLEWFAMNWFGTDYGLDFGEEIFLKADSMRSLPLTEVIRYTEEQEGDRLKITARCIVYHYNDYEYLDKEDILNHEAYAARKKAILKGRATDYSSYSVFDVSFLLNASSIDQYKAFSRFISFTSYGRTDGTTELSIPAWPTPAGKGKTPVDYNAAIKVSMTDETGANYYSFQNEDSKALLQLLDNFVYDEGDCNCSATCYIYLPGEEYAHFGIKLDSDDAYARGNGGQITLSEKDISTIRAIFDRNLTEEALTTPPGRLDVNSPVTVYMASNEEAQRVAHAYTFQNEDSRTLLKLLDETPFTINSNCYCIHPLSIHLEDGTSFGVGLKNDSYLVTHAINDADNGVTFTDEEATIIEGILTRNLTEKHRKPESDLYEPL